MELTCSRCHQTVRSEDCFCPVCGLPQILYTADSAEGQNQPENWQGAVRDASQVEWKPALRSVLALAIPAGLFCSLPSPLGIFGLLLMSGTAAWVVALYMRSRRPAWITIGAGARIGLVTGIVGGWTAAAITGATLFAMRFWLHQGSVFDNFWQTFYQQVTQQWTTMGVDPQSIATLQKLLNSSEGRSGWVLVAMALLMAALILFAAAGGAISAHLLARTRRPSN
jgi:hypothetical protein